MRALAAILMLVGTISSALADDTQECKSQLDIEMAIGACSRLIGIQDAGAGTAHAHAFRGYAYYRKNQSDQAIADFSEAVRKAEIDRGAWAPTEQPHPLLWRGMTLLQKGDSRGAIRDFDPFISQFPDWPEGHYGRGLALEAMGRRDWATASYQQALALAASDGRPHAPWRPAVDKADVERRIAVLGAVVSTTGPGPGESQNGAAILTELLYAGRAAEAQEKLLQYTADHPGDQEGLYALGAAQFVGAIEHLGQSLYRYGLAPSADSSSRVPFPALPCPGQCQPREAHLRKGTRLAPDFRH